MENKITVIIEEFEFNGRYETQNYVECGLAINFNELNCKFNLVFDNKSLSEILSEIERYFSGEITKNTETVYYIPWMLGDFVIYPITFAIDVEKNKWLFRYKKSQNNEFFDFVYAMSEDDLRSVYDQIKKQYDDIDWNSNGKLDLYTFNLIKKEFEWCYSAKNLEADLNNLCLSKEIRAIYVSAMNYREPLTVRKNFVNYYVGSEIIIEFDDIILDLLIHAQGLYQWRYFEKKDIEIIGPKVKLISNGDMEFCNIHNVYNAFNFEYLNSAINSICVDITDCYPWEANSFDESKLSDSIELPENLHFNLVNGNTLSLLGWDDDFVIKIDKSN